MLQFGRKRKGNISHRIAKVIQFGHETKPRFYPMLVELLKVIQFGRETKLNFYVEI